MIDTRYLNVLRKLHARLSDGKVNWALTGSLSLALQGVPVQVNDIDVETDKAGAYEVERLFSEFVHRKVAYSSAGRIRSHFGVLMIDGVKVEIMGDVQKRSTDGTWEKPADLERYKRFVEVEGMQLPVLSLDYEYEGYLKLGRTEKSELIKKWLKTLTRMSCSLYQSLRDSGVMYYG